MTGLWTLERPMICSHARYMIRSMGTRSEWCRLCGVVHYGVGGSGEGKPSPLHVGFSYLSELS